MPETTIKLEAELVEKVVAMKPNGASVSSYVRGLIEAEHQARRHREAALAYRQFLQENAEERQAMEVWERAPLGDDIDTPPS